MQSYTWKVTDPKLITKMKNATTGTKFRSQTFRLFNLTWEFELWPNGQSGKTRRNVMIYLVLCGLSPNVKSINIWRNYVFVEGNIEHDYNAELTHDRHAQYCNSWKLGTLTTTNIQNFNQFTFKVDVKLYNVFDINGEDIADKYLKNTEYKKDDSVFTEDKQLNAAKLDSIIIQIEKLNKTVSTMQQKMNNLELRMDEEQKKK
eukprot:496644_1